MWFVFDQRVPEIYYNGEDFQYQILTRPSGVRRQTRDGSRFRKHVPFISADSFSYQLTVSDADGLDVFVQAVNKEGEAPRSTLQPIEIPGRRTGKCVRCCHMPSTMCRMSRLTLAGLSGMTVSCFILLKDILQRGCPSRKDPICGV